MILHICPRDSWLAAEITAASLESDGFMHCSDLGTVHLPANRLFAGRTDLVLLEIDPTLVGVPVLWEPGVPAIENGPWFPHVYGPIPAKAVVAVHDFQPGPTGEFTLAESLARR